MTPLNIIALGQAAEAEAMGNKAKGLSDLKAAGFRVPDGFVITAQASRKILQEAALTSPVEAALDRLTRDNVAEISREILDRTKDLSLPGDLGQEIEEKLDPTTNYAIRSSGTMEDMAEASFAGQYDSFLEIPSGQVASKIIDCLRSLWSEPILSYLLDKGLDPKKAGLAILVQEMVAADYAGVIFTINPLTGKDREMLLEVVPGLGDALVSGRTTPQSYRYNWYDKRVYLPEGAQLNKGQVWAIGQMAFQIQLHYGYPVDVEFAIRNGRVYCLQARPITKINYQAIEDQWSTADFKDGGVSATVCKPLMWSLYEYAWDNSLKGFLEEGKILKLAPHRKLSRMFFGRPYWNLSVVREAMAQIPGYKQREFDREFGLAPTYEGDGQVTKITPATVLSTARMGLAQRKLLKERKEEAQSLYKNLVLDYERYLHRLPDLKGMYLKDAWEKLIHEDYLHSEGTYFRQIFLNTIHHSLQRDALMKRVDLAEYYSLIGGLSNVSHLRPYYELWDLRTEILKEPASLAYWQQPTEELKRDLQGGRADHAMTHFREILGRYDYHSNKELDVSYPNFAEDASPFIETLKEFLNLEDDYSPALDQMRAHEAYLNTVAEVGKRHGFAAQNKLSKIVKKTREMLWWREEFRDVSTRYYHLIRLYTMKLAELLVKEGALKEADDIWFLKIGNIQKYLDGASHKEKLKDLVKLNRRYYHSFRNFTSDNEIGEGFQALKTEVAEDVLVQGLPAGRGQVTATARVIQDLADASRLEAGDILITKFTDTGWTGKFASLSGVVTEYGGVLCHAALVSREYDIPCVVAAQDALTKIRDGETITVNGATGEIRKGSL